eukprot:1180755-Prorocentrum_minimum.AAC.9
MGELNFRVTRWLNKVLTVHSAVSVSSPSSNQDCQKGAARRFVNRLNREIGREQGDREELNRGLMDSPQLWHFFGVRKYLGGELNSPVVEWFNKGLMSLLSPSSAPGDPSLHTWPHTPFVAWRFHRPSQQAVVTSPAHESCESNLKLW